jgi:tape measure domain-containing protein
VSNVENDPFNVEVALTSTGDEVKYAAELERLIERAFRNASKTLVSELNKGMGQVFGGKDAIGDAFKGGSRSVKNFNDELERSKDLQRVMEDRLRSMESNARAAFNPNSLGLMNRAVLNLQDQVERLGTDFTQMSADAVKAFNAVSRAEGRVGFADLGANQLIDRAARRASNEKIAAEQAATRVTIQESKERIVAAQQEGSRVLAETRAAGQRRVAMIQAFSKQIQIAESAIGATFRGTAALISAAASGIGSGFQRAVALFRSNGEEIGGVMRGAATDVSISSDRINRELTSGFSSSLERRESVLRSSMSSQESILRNSITRQSVQLDRFERQLSTGILGAATGRSAAAGALGFGGISAIAGGAGLAGLLTSGFTRFSDIQRLNAQFLALTGNQERAAILMQQIKDFARLTPFDLVGVADLAKGFLAMGTAAEDVLPQVQTIADAVALTGGGTDELVRIQRAIGQVVSAGRLQGDELNQLAENLPGLNIRQILADQLTGGNTAALVEMQEAGELSADSFVTALMAGLGGDPRIAGAAVTLAGTLKGRFDNLKEQFADFGAAVIGLVAAPMAKAFGLISVGLENISRFIRGEDLSAALNLIRDAAAGAALAIGGLLIAKVAGEALQILATGISRLFTPLGLVIAVVGAVGAGLKVLTDRSPAFAQALEQTGAIIGAAFTVVKDVVGGVFSTVADAVGLAPGSVGGAIASFGDFLAEKLTALNGILLDFVGNRLRPILEGFVGWMQDTAIPGLVSAFGAVRDWVVNTVAPALADAFRATSSFVTGTLVPIVVEVARNIAEFAVVAGKAIGNFAVDVAKFARANDELFGILGGGIAGFAIGGPLGAAIGAGIGAIVTNFEKIAPVIQPATDAITGFIDNVRRSGFADAFAEIGRGVLDTFGNIGSRIVDGLDAGWDAVTDFFNDINWVDLGKGALDLVEEFGRIIGSIATNPNVVTAIAKVVAAIAGAAALVVIRFGEGLVRGIAGNLDEWMRRAFNGLGDAVEFVFRENLEMLPEILLGLVGGGIAIQGLRAMFADYGKGAGTGFMGGFRQAIQGTGGTAAGFGTVTSGFFSGLFRDFDSIAGRARTAGENATKATLNEIQRMRTTLRAVGRDPIRIPTPEISPQAFAYERGRLKTEMDKLIAQIGPGGVAAIDLRVAARNLGDSFRNFGADGIRQGFRDMGSAIREGGRTLAQHAGTIGRSVATSLAGGLAGFQLGRSGGQAGGLLEVLLGIGGGAATGFLVGQGPGAVVGATAAAIGAAFGTIEASAKKAKDEINEYADALRGLKGDELEDALDTKILENFRDETIEVRRALQDLGFNVGDLARAFQGGQQAVDDYAASLVDGFGPESREWARLLRDDVIQLDSDMGDLAVAGIDLNRVAEEMGIGIGDLGDIIGFLRDESGETALALEGLGIETSVSSETAGRAQLNFRGWGGVMDAVRGSAGGLAVDLSKIGGFKDAVRDTFFAFDDEPVREVESAAERAAEMTQRLKDRADNARDAIGQMLGVGVIDDFQERMNDLIISFENLPSQLAELDLSIGIDQAKFANEVDNVVDQFNDGVRQGIEDGVITGTPQILTERDKVLAQLTEQLERDGLTPVEAKFLWDATAAINGVVVEDQAQLEQLIRDALRVDENGLVVRLPITVAPNVNRVNSDLDPALVRWNRMLRQEGGNNAPQMGFGGGGGGGGLSPTEFGLPASVTVGLPVNVTPQISVTTAQTQLTTIGASLTVFLANGFVSGINTFITAVGAVINAGLKTIGASYSAWFAGGQAIGSLFSAGLSSIGYPIINTLAAVLNAGLRTVAASYRAWFDGGANIGKALAAGFASIGYPIINTLAALINAGLRTIGSSYPAWYGAGQNIGRAIASGIGSQIQAIADAAAAAVRWAIYAAQSTAKIKSPSQVFMEIGGFMGEGMAIGINNSVAQVAAAASNLATNAAGVVAGVEQAVRVQPVASGTVSRIVDASGGTTGSVVVNVNLGGNIYGDRAFEQKVEDAFNQVGQAIATRPRTAVGFGV